MKNNKPLYLFIGCFLIPLVAAVLVLKSGWLPDTQSNNGRFLGEQVEVPTWQDYPLSPWTIAMVNAPQCDACEAQWQDVQSLYVALGKNQGKVRLAVLGEEPEAVQSEHPTLHISSAPQQLKAGNLYLIDHHGLVVLEYDYAPVEEENRMVHKGLLKDLKKLLNYSRSS
ncbi:transmembrane cytochrome oxidase associated protein [Pseudoalteromonas sp. SSDWG2]|uniref:transmembrane cytochrome oxidase associated protein n=1 Tax=Pseudoalteromonas sp. SSDWG2 TaxID=3139391 RepID=UPI003BAC48C0